MGWYHYQYAEDGSPDKKKINGSCPDGTCTTGATRQSSSSSSTSSPTTTLTTTTSSSNNTSHSNRVVSENNNNNNTNTTHDDTGTAHDDDDIVDNPTGDETEELYYGTQPIYHLCQKQKWMRAIEMGEPYFPPTFWLDGRFTRASCELESLPTTANHYYKSIPGEWICLELDPVLLRACGIPIATHRAPESLGSVTTTSTTTGTTTTSTTPVQCLKVYGGIPTTTTITTNNHHHGGGGGSSSIVRTVYSMERDSRDGTFYGMKPDPRTPSSSTFRWIRTGMETAPSPMRTNNGKETTTTTIMDHDEKKETDEGRQVPVTTAKPESALEVSNTGMSKRGGFWRRGK